MDEGLERLRRAAERGQHEAAQAAAEALVTGRPGDPDARLALGFVCQQADRLDEAEVHYREGIALAGNAGSGKGELLLGLLRLARGDASEARARLFQAVSLLPELAVGHFHLGQLLQAEGDLAGARQHYERALDTGLEGFSPLLQRLGEMALAEQDAEEAIAWYRKATEAQADDVAAWLGLALALGNAGAWQASVDAYREAAELAPGNADVFFLLGWQLYQADLLEQAASAMAEALDRCPEHLGALLGLGLIEGRLGRFPQATACFQRALKLAPDHPDARFWLAVSLTNEDYPEDAREALEVLLEGPAGRSSLVRGLAHALAVPTA